MNVLVYGPPPLLPSKTPRNTDVPVAPPTLAATATATDPAAPISLPETRELMLAEMKRALNVGFGLGAHGLGASGNNHQVEGGMTVTPDNSNPESSDSGIQPLATLPPEGSFDRFLMDL